MSTDAYTLTEPEGSITVSAGALAQLVVRSAEGVAGARVRRPRRGLDVSVADGKAAVSLELAARYGEVLPELARAVQERVAGTLDRMCGLQVSAVDVSVEELET